MVAHVLSPEMQLQERLRASPTQFIQLPCIESLEKTFETSAAPAAPAEAERGQLQKRVHFKVDDKDKILTRVYVYAAVPPQLRRDVYLSKYELNKLRRERKACEKKFSLCVEYVISIERLLDSPLKCHLFQNHLTEQEAIATVTEASQVRGLESRLSTLIQGHHRWAIRAVLRRHEQLRKDEIEHKEVLLRAICEQVSECNREFAYKLAQGDRIEALKVYHESEDST